MSELLYNKSKAVEELNKVEGFYPLELARVISNEGQEEQRYLDVKYRKLWFRLVNPTGKIISRIVHFTENMAVVEARIYLDKCDQEDNYIANSFSQKFRTADIQFGDKFLEMAETAAIGRALADAGYGLQFADVGEGNDPMQVDAGIPVNQGTQMQTAMPAQTPAPGMQQTPNQSAGTMPSFPPQATPGQQMMEQFYQEAQANGNTIGGVTGTGQMTNPVMSPATGSVPVMQQMPSKPQFLDPNMPVEELVKWMSYEQAIQVAVTGQGKFSGKTMGQVAIESPSSLSGDTFICVAGVNQYRNLKPVLETLKSRHLQHLYEAYDMDKKMKVYCDGDSEKCDACQRKPATFYCPHKMQKRQILQNACRKVYEICSGLSISMSRMVWDMDSYGEWNGQIKGIDDYYYVLKNTG